MSESKNMSAWANTGGPGMAKYLVEKKDEGLISWNHDDEHPQDREEDMLKRPGMIPGETFLLVEDHNGEGAKKQAEAWFDGTHREPGKIDAWVEDAKRRQKEMREGTT